MLFVLGYAVIMSMYGGGFATIPAYLRDLFGTMQVGAIHGRLLTAWSVAGIAGPGAGELPPRVPDRAAACRRRRRTRSTMYVMAGLLVVGFVVQPARPAARQGRTRMSDNRLLLVISWLWVGVPLAWGVLQTLRTSLALFQ